VNNIAVKKEDIKPKDVYEEHQWITKSYKEDGLPEKEAVSKAWDFLLDKALAEMR